MRRLVMIRRVEGHSMLPTLKPGRIVLASGYLGVSIGKVVIAEHNGIEIIKRVKSVSSERLELTGDNINSSHNAHVEKSAILGVVLNARV